MKKNKIILEKSTNTHFSNTKKVYVVKEIPKMTTILLNTEESMIVEHGHHNVVATEKDTKFVIKITQQEFNPILQAFQNSFD